ncbi:nitrate reductase molybdenum cofactor assembly chaperone [Streptomyces boninensis]|uniref:nitrate reductase molybdenum cofactor assembly chaperone n=1 Tax=Streptomyces boninensis TaxID=2039455 RepID=UPI003B21E72A
MTADDRARAVHRVAAVALAYPDAELAADLPEMRELAAGDRHLPAFLDHCAATPLAELAAHYTEVFDFRARRCLYLTWWRDGDTRRRGVALVAFKEAYRAHGLEFTGGGELPDFLPAVLHFTATTGDTSLLDEHRAGLELLRLSLEDCGTPYARVLQAVCATLPGPSPKDRAAAMQMARNGPPREDVGLEPYGATPLPMPGFPAPEPLPAGDPR